MEQKANVFLFLAWLNVKTAQNVKVVTDLNQIKISDCFVI